MLYMHMHCKKRWISHLFRRRFLAPAPLIRWRQYLLRCVWLCIGLNESPTTIITYGVKSIRVSDSVNVVVTTPTAPNIESLAIVTLCSSDSATPRDVALDWRCRRRRRRRRRHGDGRVGGLAYGKHYYVYLDWDAATSIKHTYIQAKHTTND